eukprot:CAMPEP_0176476364 /NCGR_PEP_ID=MMETSP0200_2-20121128/11_1 /TAXON_ID=947934 /ORGANISM="Chaetoceros sp., Strain GSL56" /LENGTH=694 /DNA_ID=CAMNT_0017872025 /DNA_START=1955 /DNA_END=4036 /DNA_ORIENTATION=+
MKLRYSHTVTKCALDLVDFQSKVNALAYSPDSAYLAVATNDRWISIFDARTNERVDHFSTKPNNKGPKDYLVTAIHFQPQDDSTPKLAVGQSDCILFVYRWTQDESVPEKLVWQGKKSIVNKFPESAAIVSIVWPPNIASQCVYALSNGKIKVGNLRTNKSHILYAVDSFTVSLAMKANGTELLSGHGDGSIYKFRFPTVSQESSYDKLFHSSQTPLLLVWISSICVGGTGPDLTFYDVDGNKEQVLSVDDGRCSSLNVVCSSPNGRSIVVGSNDMLYLLTREVQSKYWINLDSKPLLNIVSSTALAWSPNGSSVAVGSAAGLLNVYSTIYRRYMYNNTFAITHLSPTDVIIHDKENPNSTPISIQSRLGEIERIDIYPEPGFTELRYVVGKVTDALILCDIKASPPKVSQIPWNWSSEVSFSFHDTNACLISSNKKLSVIQYGKDDLLGTFNTDFTALSVVSLRTNSSENDFVESSQIAFLSDTKNIRIDFLDKYKSPLNIYHHHAIEFLELSDICRYCLFLDENSDLYVFDITIRIKLHLVSNCKYAQWVPLTNAVVALSQKSMYVWYNVKYYDIPVTRDVEGDITDIVCEEGKVQVHVSSGTTHKVFTLQEEFLQFSVAIDAKDIHTCVDLLANIENSPMLDSMKDQLLDLSIECFDLQTAYNYAIAHGNSNLAECIKSVSVHEESESLSR